MLLLVVEASVVAVEWGDASATGQKNQGGSMSSKDARQQGTGHACLRMVMAAGLVLVLGGCDFISGMMDSRTPEQVRDEGIALGAGCRQSGQTLEDCYKKNPKSQKAGVYAGWKEMHEYMAAMNIETAKKAEEKKPEPDPIKNLLDPNSDPKAAGTALPAAPKAALTPSEVARDRRDRDRESRVEQRRRDTEQRQREREREQRRKAREERAAARDAARNAQVDL